jgi:hypothetical protein
MGSAGEYGDIHVAQLSDDQLARVTGGGGDGEAFNVLIRHREGVAEFICECAEAAAEHDAHLRAKTEFGFHY